MKDINCIVVPVDFSEITGQLVEYAVNMAGKLSADIHFVHVVHFYAGDGMTGLASLQVLEERMVSNAKERISIIVKDTREKGAGCTGDVLIGDPVDEIIQFAEEKKSELLIISTHGAKGLEKILLGSVAERVLKRAHCPVLFMNPHKK